MLVVDEPYSLEPKQNRKVGSVDIATGSPALAGRVEAAEAPYEPGGEGVVSDSEWAGGYSAHGCHASGDAA